jgi:hypothetical protein
MRRAIVTAVLLSALVGAPAALAAEGKAPPPDQSVTLSPVALPLVFDGQIVNYVFATVKLMLTPQADAIALRDKEPYFRDALVRAAHRTPFVRAGDYNNLDDNKLKASLYRDASMIAGPGKIAGVVITSETTQHRIPTHRQAEGAAIVP